MYQNADKLLRLDQICNLLNRALSQTSSSQMICDLTVQRRGNLGSQNAMNAVDGATIERRIRINRPDDENTRCKASSRRWPDRRQERRALRHNEPRWERRLFFGFRHGFQTDVAR